MNYLSFKNIFSIAQLSYLSIFLFSLNSLSKDIIIAGDQWCPYVCSPKDEIGRGFSVELVEMALKEMSHRSTYVNSGFPRLIRNIEEDVWHVVTGTDKRFSPKLYISKEPVAYTKWSFVTLKGRKWKYTGVESLRNIRLGTVAGYVYSDRVMEHIEKNLETGLVTPIYSFNPQKLNLQKLSYGRIDTFLGEEAVIKYWAKKIGIHKNIKFVGVDFEAPLFCGLNRFNSKLSSEIDEGIRRLKKTKKIQKLLKKYGITNWKL